MTADRGRHPGGAGLIGPPSFPVYSCLWRLEWKSPHQKGLVLIIELAGTVSASSLHQNVLKTGLRINLRQPRGIGDCASFVQVSPDSL